jgi:hypothetical protein
MGYRVGRWAVLSECQMLAVCGVRSGCYGSGWRLFSCVGFVGWCLVWLGVGSVWVLCGGITLSVQNLVCDGCRWMVAEGCFVGVLASVW